MYLQYPLLLKHATLLQYVLVLDNRALLQFYFFFNTMVVLVIGIVIYRLCLNSLPKYSVRHFGRELRHWLVVYRTMPVYLNLFECIITANPLSLKDFYQVRTSREDISQVMEDAQKSLFLVGRTTILYIKKSE